MKKTVLALWLLPVAIVCQLLHPQDEVNIGTPIKTIVENATNAIQSSFNETLKSLQDESEDTQAIKDTIIQVGDYLKGYEQFIATVKRHAQNSTDYFFEQLHNIVANSTTLLDEYKAIAKESAETAELSKDIEQAKKNLNAAKDKFTELMNKEINNLSTKLQSHQIKVLKEKLKNTFKKPSAKEFDEGITSTIKTFLVDFWQEFNGNIRKGVEESYIIARDKLLKSIEEDAEKIKEALQKQGREYLLNKATSFGRNQANVPQNELRKDIEQFSEFIRNRDKYRAEQKKALENVLELDNNLHIVNVDLKKFTELVNNKAIITAKNLYDDNLNDNILHRVLKNFDTLNAETKANLPKFIETALKGGIDINERGDRNETALTYAIRFAPPEIAILLLDRYKADPTTKNIFNVTPLMEAVTKRADPVLIDKLLKSVAAKTISDHNNLGDTALLLLTACEKCENVPGIIEMLLAAGAKVDEKNSITGRNALFKAAYKLDQRSVEFLLSKGANAKAVDRNNITPLLNMLWKSRSVKEDEKFKSLTDEQFDTYLKNIAEMLINAGTNIDAQDKDGNSTALMWAAEYGWPQTTKLLLDKGANKNLKDITGATAKDHALTRGRNQAVIRLFE